MTSTTKYTKTAILLHWLIALGIIAMFGLGWYMTDLPKQTPDRAFFYNLHKSIGITILALVAFRFYWRISHKPPAMLPSWTATEKKIATGTHHLLYILMFAMPVTGLVMSSFSKFGAKWFGITVLAGADNPAMRDNFAEIHETVGVILLVLVALHFVGALKHHFKDKDGTMQRMTLK